jgi:hypothetical protein
MREFRFKKGRVLIVLLLLGAMTLAGCASDVVAKNTSDVPTAGADKIDAAAAAQADEGYTLKVVDGGDTSGVREANAVVDTGYGDRVYLAYTNEYGQLIKVTAERIIPQSESEPLVDGRYYEDEAKVPGTEAEDLDEGHVIADSLGGVSNAYNITPQNRVLNRHGDQAYMEKVIRDAGGCTNFVAIITYPNTQTQIPSHYSYTYTINGIVINDEFDNADPDAANEELNEVSMSLEKGEVYIAHLDKKAELVEIKNDGDEPVNLEGWRLLSVRGNQAFVFPKYILKSKSSVMVGDTNANVDVDLHWMEGKGVWSNSDSDPAELYDAEGKLVSRFE